MAKKKKKKKSPKIVLGVDIGGSGIKGALVDVRRGTVETATNITDDWIGTDAQKLIGKATGLRCTVLNDADAAGIAEVQFGAGKGKKGLIVVLTLGTGIGSALFIDGRLVPNTEFGLLRWRGDII
jgi:polyphosphate glucokinase